MRNSVGILIGLLATFGALADGMRVEAVQSDNEIRVTTAGKLFTAYKTHPDQKYPYFFPLAGPATWKSVTTETSEPYPHHHSLFFGCDFVNGSNYWQEANDKGQIVSQGPRIVEAAGSRVVIEDTCLWLRPGGEPDIRDTRHITIAAPGELYRTVDFDITLEPLKDVEIKKTNHSLFSARVVPELSVASGGTLVNAEGKEKEAGTFGAASPWCSYSGMRDGLREGIAIFQNPSNRWYPSPWFTRDYGFFSPTPMYWLDGDKLNLKKGEAFTLKYRVVVFVGDVNMTFLFDEYVKGPEAPKPLK